MERDARIEVVNEEDENIQLDLFSPDRVMVGQAFNALGKVDLHAAMTLLEEVLSRWPDTLDAREGYRLASDWLKTSEVRESEFMLFWERIKGYPFGALGAGLRRGLIRKLIAAVGDEDIYLDQDLSLDRLYFEVDDLARAEESFSRLIEKHPLDGRLHLALGNTLSVQNREGEARAAYAKGLLASPSAIEPAMIMDDEVRALVDEVGAFAAPVFGWIRGALPIVRMRPVPCNPEHDRNLHVYELLGNAEQARMDGNHDEMVQYRRLLRDAAPDVWEEYRENFLGR